MVSMVIVLCEVTAILGNGCEVQGQKYVASEIPIEFHYGNLISGI